MAGFCAGCGSPIGDDHAFCIRCGMAKQDAPSAGTAAQDAPAFPPPAPNAPAAQPAVQAAVAAGAYVPPPPAAAPTPMAPAVGSGTKTGAGTARTYGLLAVTVLAVSAAIDAFLLVWVAAKLNITLDQGQFAALEAVALVADLAAVAIVFVALLRRAQAEAAR